MELQIPKDAFEILKSHRVKAFKCKDFEVEFFEEKEEEFELPEFNDEDKKTLTEEDITFYSTNEPLSIEREDRADGN